MLYHLLPRLEDVHIVFNLFNYLTVRSAGAMASALILMLILGRPFIAFMRARGIVNVPRNGLDRGQGAKVNMGGVLIVAVVAVSTLLWAELTNPVHDHRARGDALDGVDRLPRRLPQGRAQDAARAGRALQVGGIAGAGSGAGRVPHHVGSHRAGRGHDDEPAALRRVAARLHSGRLPVLGNRGPQRRDPLGEHDRRPSTGWRPDWSRSPSGPSGSSRT